MNECHHGVFLLISAHNSVPSLCRYFHFNAILKRIQGMMHRMPS
jgi:hypothetical protein